MTPVERHDLVTKAIKQMRDLGLALIPVTSRRAWLVDSDKVSRTYAELCQTVHVMMREVDLPGTRNKEGAV